MSHLKVIRKFVVKIHDNVCPRIWCTRWVIRCEWIQSGSSSLIDRTVSSLSFPCYSKIPVFLQQTSRWRTFKFGNMQKVLCNIKLQQVCIWLVLHFNNCVTEHGMDNVKELLLLHRYCPRCRKVPTPGVLVTTSRHVIWLRMKGTACRYGG